MSIAELTHNDKGQGTFTDNDDDAKKIPTHMELLYNTTMMKL